MTLISSENFLTFARASSNCLETALNVSESSPPISLRFSSSCSNALTSPSALSNSERVFLRLLSKSFNPLESKPIENISSMLLITFYPLLKHLKLTVHYIL